MTTPPAARGIDRSVPYPPFLVHRPVIDPSGTVVEVLAVEVGGSYGAMAADPAPFPRHSGDLLGCW